MGIKDLPGAGSKFRATTGLRNLRRQLKIAAEHGELNVLDAKQQEAVVRVAKENEIKIRRDQFTDLQQKRALARVMASDRTATKLDRGKIKNILKHLGPGGAESAKKPEAGGKMVEINGKKVFLPKEKVDRNLRLNAQKDGDLRVRQSGEVQFAGGKALVTSIGSTTDRPASGARRIMGSMKDLGVGVKEQTAGFAIRRVNNTKPTGSPPPQAPLKGFRPIGWQN